jgi:hypothetical protein
LAVVITIAITITYSSDTTPWAYLVDADDAIVQLLGQPPGALQVARAGVGSQAISALVKHNTIQCNTIIVRILDFYSVPMDMTYISKYSTHTGDTYWVSLAILMASSSLVNFMKGSTGPKVSCVKGCMSSVQPSSTVGR